MSAASLSWALASRADDVMRAAQLAACLEVCGYPKPGNVHRLRNFGELRFEHFIAGAIAIGPAIREASMKGIRHVLDGLKLGDVRLGSLMLRAVSDMIGWQRGGNTHLGTIVLFTPLAVSAGMCIAEACEFNLKLLREGFVETVKATTSLDTVDFYKAVRLANPKGMGKVRGLKSPDVMDDGFEAKILAEDVTLYEAMAECSDWDEVASEFVSGLEVTVKLGYPTL
ncbi:TPA: hypothetical protein EYP27_04850, partial [Candidatus Bathyarchaeota archaeon]|nr:hypothetical protein [Candidatus Bathyarchaeota archaeon]